METQIEIDYQEIIAETTLFVCENLEKSLPPKISKFKIYETSKKRKVAHKLSQVSDLSSMDLVALALAVEFSNADYISSSTRPPVETAVIAQSFLEGKEVPSEIIEKVVECLHIDAKRGKPQSELEKIYLDTSNSIFASKSYLKKILPRIMEEQEIDIYNPLKTRAWLKQHRAKLKNINFYTTRAKKRYAKSLKQNIQKLKQIRNGKKDHIGIYNMPLDKSKGVQMMFKTALRNHIDLSSIADNKASIMLSINAIIITIAMPLLIRYMSDDPYLVIPMITLMITCVLSIILAALATRPAKTNGETDINRVMEKTSSNLFFFGNFYNVDLESYQEGMKRVIRSNKVLERSAINDLYYLGKSLGDKFNLLRMCYMVFMAGVVLYLSHIN